MPRLTVFFGLLVLLGTATTSAAQDADDWDVVSTPDQDLIVAGVQYASGSGLSVQCQHNRLLVILAGMPASNESVQTFDATLGNGETRRMRWSSGAGPLTTMSARTARLLKHGGKLTLSSVIGAAHPTRAEFDLPTQSSGIDQVLSACGYRSIDDRDDLPQIDDLITTWPKIDMPSAVLDRHPAFEVAFSCIVASARLSQCRSDHTNPDDRPGGAQTAREANGARLGLTDATAAEGRVIDLYVVGQRTNR